MTNEVECFLILLKAVSSFYEGNVQIFCCFFSTRLYVLLICRISYTLWLQVFSSDNLFWLCGLLFFSFNRSKILKFLMYVQFIHFFPIVSAFSVLLALFLCTPGSQRCFPPKGFFWLCCSVCGIVIPQPADIEPGPSAWKCGVPTTEPPGNSLQSLFVLPFFTQICRSSGIDCVYVC